MKKFTNCGANSLNSFCDRRFNMAQEKMHSICKWTFNAGKGGFVPGDMRPEWGNLSSADVINIVKKEIKPRLPKHIVLGMELHYDGEVNEKTAGAISKALTSAGMHLAMITPGAHSHWAYGGITSLDPKERAAAESFGAKTVDLAYGVLQKNWHPDPKLAPTFVLWNGSFGYDLASIGIRNMYQNLKESVAKLCKYEQKRGGKLYFGIEPKPNEGHPCMLLPTVASALLFWRKLEDEFGVPRKNKGVNKEFGHSEMIGLDHVYDTVEEIDDNALVHMHVNSQGYNDGIVCGGPGKYDIDHGSRINGMNIAVAGLLLESGFRRWRGHDMQARAYDNVPQAIDRVVRSVLSWEACEKAAADLDTKLLLKYLAARETAKAEDLLRRSVTNAYSIFDKFYNKGK